MNEAKGGGVDRLEDVSVVLALRSAIDGHLDEADLDSARVAALLGLEPQRLIAAR